MRTHLLILKHILESQGQVGKHLGNRDTPSQESFFSNKRQVRKLHNDKEYNPIRRYDFHKCTQCRSTKVYKENFNGLKRRNLKQHNDIRKL